MGVLVDGQGAGLDYQVVDAHADALGKLLVEFTAELGGAGHVDLGDNVEVGGLPHTAGRARGNGPPHGTEGYFILVAGNACGGGGGLCVGRVGGLSRIYFDDGQRRAHGDDFPGWNVNAPQNAARRRVHLHDGLVRLDFGENIPSFHGVARRLQPLDDGAVLHLMVQLGHLNVYGLGQNLLQR